MNRYVAFLFGHCQDCGTKIPTPFTSPLAKSEVLAHVQQIHSHVRHINSRPIMGAAVPDTTLYIPQDDIELDDSPPKIMTIDEFFDRM